ncbi:MAG: hypothetical protein JSV16_16480 [Candidatus Hydrogenedentota bacterium]|nr:MAG: hypothetical protein JSV16_16480 [Candidatus Hydrogenedentota bacterium]
MLEKKTIFAIVLGVVAVGVVVYQVVNISPSGPKSITSAIAAPTPSPIVSESKAPAVSVQVASETPTVDDYDSLIERLKEADLDYKSRRFRNPMTPLISEAELAKSSIWGPASRVELGPTNALSLGYSIEGIVWNEMQPMALINDQVVAVGELLDDGSLITEITRDTVRFTKDGEKYFLVLREE